EDAVPISEHPTRDSPILLLIWSRYGGEGRAEPGRWFPKIRGADPSSAPLPIGLEDCSKKQDCPVRQRGGWLILFAPKTEKSGTRHDEKAVRYPPRVSEPTGACGMYGFTQIPSARIIGYPD